MGGGERARSESVEEAVCMLVYLREKLRNQEATLSVQRIQPIVAALWKQPSCMVVGGRTVASVHGNCLQRHAVQPANEEILQ